MRTYRTSGRHLGRALGLATVLAIGLSVIARPATADSDSDYLDLSQGDIPLAESIAPRAQDPLVLNGLPNFRSTGSINLIGIRPAEGFRIEADVSSRRSDSAFAALGRTYGFGGLDQSPNGRFGSLATGVSLIHDWDADGPVRPYVLGGLGASRLVERRGLDDRVYALAERLVFDFQLGAGLGFSLGEDMTLAAGYRFVSNLGRVAGLGAQEHTTAGRKTSSHLFGITMKVPFGNLTGSPLARS